MITVVNVRKKQPSDFPPTFVYVGRRTGPWRGSPLGNPYKPTADTDAIALFRQWLWSQLQDPTSPATVELHRSKWQNSTVSRDVRQICPLRYRLDCTILAPIVGAACG